MKIKYLLSIFAFLTLFSSKVFAQGNVAINTTGTGPDNSAMLDITSTSKGMLIPRMSTSQRTGIASPARGLLVYDNDLDEFWYYDGGAWVSLSASPADNLGNHTATTNIRLNGNWLSNDGSNTGIQVTNSGNVGIGTTNPQRAFSVSGIMEGQQVRLGDLTTVTNPRSLTVYYDNTYGTDGAGVLQPVRINVGYTPLIINPLGGNIGIGTTNPQRLFSVNGSMEGSQVRLGELTTVPNFRQLTVYYDNTFGNGTDGAGVIQAVRSGVGYTPLVINYQGGNVGIGSTSPAAKLDIAGTLKITDGSQGAGKVLTSNGAGLASWQAPGAGSVRQIIVAQTSAVIAGTGTIPFDNTTPQITEGSEFLTATITPQSSTSNLLVEVIVTMSETANHSNQLTGAIFRDAGTNAIVAGTTDLSHNNVVYGTANNYSDSPFVLKVLVPATSTTATTFRFRAGGDAGAVEINRYGGTQYLNGSLISIMTITEIAN